MSSKVSIILGQGSWLMVNKPLIKIIGHIPAILLADLVTKWESFDYQEFYNSADQIYDSCHLTRPQIKRAVDKLIKHDLISYEVKGVPPVMNFNIKEDNIIRLIFQSVENQFRQKVKINFDKRSKSISTKGQNQNEQKVKNYITKNKEQESITENKNNTEKQVFGSFPDPEKDDSGRSSLSGSGKKEKKLTAAQKKEKEVVSDVMDYLNEKTERSLRKDSTAARQIWHRYKDGATVKEMKRVIDDKVKEWIDGEMKKYLHPSTLFLKRNYEKYVEQLPSEPETNYDQFFEKVKPEIDNQIKESNLLMIWDDKQNTSLISIYKKIKDLMIENGEDPKINAATEMICWVIKSMDDFHRNNFSIDYLDRNFIKILNQVKNEKDNKRNKGIDSIREFSRALGEELGI